MKIPKKIRIGGHMFKVIFCEIKKKDDCYGLVDVEKFEIHLDISLKGTKKAMEVLYHETMHAIDYVYNAYSLGEKANERLSQGWYQVIKENPGLRKI